MPGTLPSTPDNPTYSSEAKQYWLSWQGFRSHVYYALGMIPSFFTDGVCWQSAAFISGLQDWLPSSAAFAFMTGIGAGIGVFSGNMIVHTLRLIYSYCNPHQTVTSTLYTRTRDATFESILHAIAGFVAGSIWQPVVNVLSTLNWGWSVPFLGTGIACGTAFFIVLIILTLLVPHLFCFWHDHPNYALVVDGKLNWRLLRSHFTFSLWNVTASAAFFTLTLIGYPIEVTHPGLQILLAGIYQATGGIVSQGIELIIKRIAILFELMPIAHLPPPPQHTLTHYSQLDETEPLLT